MWTSFSPKFEEIHTSNIEFWFSVVFSFCENLRSYQTSLNSSVYLSQVIVFKVMWHNNVDILWMMYRTVNVQSRWSVADANFWRMFFYGFSNNMFILWFWARGLLIYCHRYVAAVLNQYSILFKISRLSGRTPVRCFRLSVWPDMAVDSMTGPVKFY